MESEKQAVSVPSTSSSMGKQVKTSQEPNISGKPRSKEATDAGKTAKTVKQVRRKQPKPLPSVTTMRPDPHLRETVKKLHDRTKHVKSKLTRLKQTLPSVEIDKNKPDLTEDEILHEIERLQGLVREIRLKSAEPPRQRKNSDMRKSFQSDATTADNGEKCEETPITCSEKQKAEKSKKRRVRTKTRKDTADENQLQNLYESHINKIIRGDDTDDSKWDDLEFQLGDDLEEFAQKCVAAGLGSIVAAEVRVNAKNNHQAFITMNEGSDGMISSMAARKYAMDGDLVSAFIRHPPAGLKTSVGNADESIDAVIDVSIDPENVLTTDVEMLEETVAKSSSTSRQAFVIRIIKEIGNRSFIGSISFKNPTKLDNSEYFKFKPRDTKVPMIYIPAESCEEMHQKQKHDDSLGFLYLAQLTEIKDNGRCIGKLESAVGRCGNLEAEIKAILMHNNLTDVVPFEERFETMWTNPPIKPDMGKRADLRKECIFTIDPLTARDLDDAVSCKLMDNGCYEIGVHISDVSCFLEEMSELDEIVKLRATSIYLVNEVIHMLPKTLCMLCSLLPDEDKNAFSVFWVINQNAEVISTRFTRSKIRSCTQLAYEHAQKIIDNPNESFTVDDFPTICNGFGVTDIVERVKALNSLAVIMRKKRFENGSLSIDKPQFYFVFDPKTGEPTSYEISSRLTANFLIEEFMLLANQSVAQFIYKRFPSIAFLRNHQPPKPSAIRNLKAKLSAVGIDLDMSTSKSIFDGLKKVCGASASPDVLSAGMNYLLTKPMMRAKYFCSEKVETDGELRHYALAIPIYTHFTSPIRRYPDIIVHRLLSAALDYTSPPKRTPDELHDLAQICNDQKFYAKSAGEESANLFFQRYVKSKKSINLRAVVTDIYRNSMEVITIETGHLICIQFKLQKVVVDASKAPAAVFISEKNSQKPPVELRMFSALNVKLVIWEGKLAGFFVTPDREQRIINSILASNGKPDLDSPPRKRNRKRGARKSQKKEQTKSVSDN